MSEAFPSRFSTPEQSPGYQLWRVNNLWQRHIRKALLPYGLTHVQFVLLAAIAWLSKSQDAVTQAQAAQVAGADEMMASQVIRTLETRGLLRRRPHPADRRARCVALTTEGHSLTQRALVAVEEGDANFFSVVESDATLLPKLLNEIILAHSIQVSV